MMLPLVPLPLGLRPSDSPALRVTADLRITGDTDAAAALTALISARTGVEPAGSEGGTAVIDLRREPGGTAESYRITVDAASARITAPDAAGLFYAVQTLGQLITRDDAGFTIPAVEIADAPRFAYRGVMLDVARHFFPVDVVRDYIDRAASLKFNALHLHLSDDQGWRIHLDSRPKLTERASGSAVGGDAGGFYSKADYRRIVDYAAERHMIVVPEIDVPGHTHAVSLAYPELTEAPVLSPHVLEIVASHGGAAPVAGEPYTGMAVGFSSLRIHDEATYDFLADVFGELAGMTRGPICTSAGTRRSARPRTTSRRSSRARPRSSRISARPRSPGTRRERRPASIRARSGSTGGSASRRTAWTRRPARSSATTPDSSSRPPMRCTST